MNNNEKIQEFLTECQDRINTYPGTQLEQAAKRFMLESTQPKYSYNFQWLGRPIIQYPQDMVAMQEIIFEVKPDLIIETGIAHGGSLIFSASMLALLDYMECIASSKALDISKSQRKVLGIDIDIRDHNREAIEAHPFSKMIELIQGSAIDKSVVSEVHDFAKKFKRIMVLLDSNHTHDHVLEELKAYAPLTSKDSYCVVFDTIIEDLPDTMYPDRPWRPGNNPKTAIFEYLKDHQEFQIQEYIDNKLLISVAPKGYLKRVG